MTTNSNSLSVSQVDFDIALTEAKKSDNKGGIGIHLGALKLGSDGATHNEISSTSRITFSVPIVFNEPMS